MLILQTATWDNMAVLSENILLRLFQPIKAVNCSFTIQGHKFPPNWGFTMGYPERVPDPCVDQDCGKGGYWTWSSHFWVEIRIHSPLIAMRPPGRNHDKHGISWQLWKEKRHFHMLVPANVSWWTRSSFMLCVVRSYFSGSLFFSKFLTQNDKIRA